MILAAKIRTGKATSADYEYERKPRERVFLPKEHQNMWLMALFVPEAFKKVHGQKKRG